MFYYYELKDCSHSGMIIRKNKENRREHYYNKKSKNWEPIGIMIRYFWPESDTFEMYEELSEEEVLRMIKDEKRLFTLIISDILLINLILKVK